MIINVTINMYIHENTIGLIKSPWQIIFHINNANKEDKEETAGVGLLRTPGIYLKSEENSRKPQFGDHLKADRPVIES